MIIIIKWIFKNYIFMHKSVSSLIMVVCVLLHLFSFALIFSFINNIPFLQFQANSIVEYCFWTTHVAVHHNFIGSNVLLGVVSSPLDDSVCMKDPEAANILFL